MIKFPHFGILLGSTAFVVSSDASRAARWSAKVARLLYGDLIGICDGTADNVQIQAAIDALPAVGGKVQLTEGNFYIAAAIEIDDDNITLEGMGQKATMLHLAANDNVLEVTSTADTELYGIVLRDFGIDGEKGTYTGHGIVISTMEWSLVSNIYIHDIKSDGINTSKSGTAEGRSVRFENIHISECDGNGWTIDSSPYESFWHMCTVRNVGGYQMYFLNSRRNHISQCHLGGTNNGAAILIMLGNSDNNIIEGTWLSGVYNDTHGIYVDCVDDEIRGLVIVGNHLKGNAGSSTHDGIFISTALGTGAIHSTLISGNVVISFRYGINITDADVHKTLVTSNQLFPFMTAAIFDGGYQTDLINNKGANQKEEKKHFYMKNTSGGTLSHGHVVIYKGTAPGEEVTTVTAQGSDRVFGMVDQTTIADNGSGSILVTGFTTMLKVNGTTDIGIGTLLGCHTDAGIAMKAAAGDMAFAIALEAYTPNDSNGVIDAILITPRKI